MAIDIKTPFDDDSHTFHDGALQRFFRMRRWMFAVGIVLTLLSTNWLDYSAAIKTLAVPTLPKQVVHTWLTFAGVYLLLQGGVILRQIWATYPDSIMARAESGTPVDVAHMRSLYRELSKQRDEFEHQRSSPYSSVRTPDEIVASRRYEELSARLAQLEGAMKQREPRVRNLNQAIRSSELTLDLMRIVPSYAFLLFACIKFGAIHWNIFSLTAPIS